MDLENKEIQAPSFTLYPLVTQDLKTCYEAEHYKLICNINGPYFDRKHAHLTPLFNVSIANNCSQAQSRLTPDNIVPLTKKVQEVLDNLMLPGKYQRMVFDISFEVIAIHLNNPPSFLLSPLLNLLSYTCALRCLQTTASFGCSAVLLRQSAILWDYPSCQTKEGDRSLVLCSEGRDRKVICFSFSGQLSFLQFQKMTGICEQTNQESMRFQTSKLGQTYSLFHQ